MGPTWGDKLKGCGCPQPGAMQLSSLLDIKSLTPKNRPFLETKTTSRDNEADSRPLSTIFEKCGHN